VHHNLPRTSAEAKRNAKASRLPLATPFGAPSVTMCGEKKSSVIGKNRKEARIAAERRR